MSFAISHVGMTHQGLVRERNEDNWAAAPDLGLYIISDGLGGEFEGALASKIVVDVLPEMVRARAEAYRNLSDRKASLAIKEALAGLSAQVFAQTQGKPGLEGMGTTVVLTIVQKDKALIAHMGDSRAYLWRQGRLKLLTKDHSIVQLLLDAGEISPAEVAGHPAQGRVTRSIGMEGEPLPEARMITIQPNDFLLLCTDGLTGMVTNEEIGSILRRNSNPKRACGKLIQAALNAGGKDNVTAVVVAVARDRSDKIKGSRELRHGRTL